MANKKTRQNNETDIQAALEKAEQEAANPNTVWLSHEEIMANIAKQRKERKHVQTEISTAV